MIQNDDIFDALADVQRRRLLVGLLNDDSRHFSRLSGASREMAEASDSFLQRYLSGALELEGVEKDLLRMHHVHLPKLADYGFVEWCPETNVVRRGPRFDELRPILELLAERHDERPPIELVEPLR